ncbi:MAG TPA: LysR family transcriptional regulator [Ilumatobacteraceae bacterium]|nr:LysR family transcriptional regulator [Ilumatobacteraceae bacterium]
MTPAQLRTFAAVARHGSSKAAAAELGVTEAAVSGHVAALRKELGDELFRRSAAGLSFTPGGLRLASRAVELLGLQDQTRREVRAAADGQRLLRIAVSSLFGEYAAPGLIELFSTRADDLEVEMSVCAPADFDRLLVARAIDVAIGPASRRQREGITSKEFLRYQIVAVVGVEHPLATTIGSRDLGAHTWLLGPSAVDPSSSTSRMLQHLGVSEQRQRIFQNHAAALAEARGGHGVALCPMHTLAAELGDGRLVRVQAPRSMIEGVYATYVLRQQTPNPLASELVRFVSTPRATQAMLTGSGANVRRFRPRVHVTLWS